ncbi:Tetratricopeptide repeat-containing protein [Monaibacterium marinum]|uniref:Tetratricopeptide repeat-containing protein n=1 Tax=Pontivivens marinum TaxID=1690039 RepID=A0A2C9CTX7_9RHOB|nr:tetratricopeptide repeat protein [Monaibacterium marinum]SOH94722.1 Tetratricopeptide repeat-containing protein [Monaibacterium marinum]
MIRKITILGTVGLMTLSACEQGTPFGESPSRLNAIDSVNLTELMLTTGEPEAAVDFFRSSLADEPNRVDFQRGYAISLSRADRHDEAVLAFERLDVQGDLQDGDRMTFAQSLIRLNQWERAEAQLSLVNNGADDYRWNQLNAMLSDNYERWEEADTYYAKARSLTSQPATILNNWGVSKMSRGDLEGAARHFTDAVRYDPEGFGAKNNLAISRALRGIYALPVVPLNEEERAQLYHNMALVALRQNDSDIARGLLELAVETHPRHFSAAADKLAALQGTVNR